ncbi:MAG: hypothetical protein H0X14_00085 [Acidobacteria bacterium]|nr:hypothetical protein [Acidobacteriota bacterium]
MSIKSKVEQIERRVQAVEEDNAPCPNCIGVRASLARVYGGFTPIIHSPAACGDMHRSLEKAYGGGDYDGLKAAA